MEMTAAIQYILTAGQSLGSQDYYKESEMTILGLAAVFSMLKRAGIDKMNCHMFRRKYLVRCLGKLWEVSRNSR